MYDLENLLDDFRNVNRGDHASRARMCVIPPRVIRLCRTRCLGEPVRQTESVARRWVRFISRRLKSFLVPLLARENCASLFRKSLTTLKIATLDTTA